MDTNHRRQGGRGMVESALKSAPSSFMLTPRNAENRQLGGGKDATQRATGIWKQALEEYQEPAMDPAIREEPDNYVAQRRVQIGSEEP